MTTSVTVKPRREATSDAHATNATSNGEIVPADRPYPLALIPSTVLDMLPRPPFVARVAAGAAVYAFEESVKLPQRIIMLPMNVVSQLIQTGVQVQHFVASLAVRGDELFSTLGLEPTEAKPEWATFDEDEISLEPVDPAPAPGVGRFALYSTPVETPKEKVVTPALEPVATDVPAVADEIDYSALTLAQLRARLKGLTLEDVTALLAYEKATRGRQGFSAMLSERITALQPK